jgi:cytoskeletal protein CcmA (bactofilin family)
MGTLGKTILIRGEVRASEDLTIDGKVEGKVVCERHAVVLGPDASVTGDIFARDITVSGKTTGQLVATEVVDIRAGASVEGQVLSPRFILHEGAAFRGRVEPQHLEAALRVARFQQKKQGA